MGDINSHVIAIQDQNANNYTGEKVRFLSDPAVYPRATTTVEVKEHICRGSCLPVTAFTSSKASAEPPARQRHLLVSSPSLWSTNRVIVLRVVSQDGKALLSSALDGLSYSTLASGATLFLVQFILVRQLLQCPDPI